MPLSQDELAAMRLDDDGAPPRVTRTAFLQVYRESWTVSRTADGTWTTLRPATATERAVAASTAHGQFWLASGNGAPYCDWTARRVSDQLARIRWEYA
jgi:hypothetical protein